MSEDETLEYYKSFSKNPHDFKLSKVDIDYSDYQTTSDDESESSEYYPRANSPKKRNVQNSSVDELSQRIVDLQRMYHKLDLKIRKNNS